MFNELLDRFILDKALAEISHADQPGFIEKRGPTVGVLGLKQPAALLRVRGNSGRVGNQRGEPEGSVRTPDT